MTGPTSTRFCPQCGTSFGPRSFCPLDGTLGEGGPVFGERYRLERLIGSGGMGFVFAARHLLLGRPVAIKVLRADSGSDADQVSRFLREARLCSQLRHENIIDISDFGRDAAGDLYLVMELLAGRTLAEVLADEGRLPVGRSLGILRGLCRALACAHAAGVVHRDLTPRNVSLCPAPGGRELVKLLDFGISRLADGDDRVTSTGVPVGTTPGGDPSFTGTARGPRVAAPVPGDGLPRSPQGGR